MQVRVTYSGQQNLRPGLAPAQVLELELLSAPTARQMFQQLLLSWFLMFGIAHLLPVRNVTTVDPVQGAVCIIWNSWV